MTKEELSHWFKEKIADESGTSIEDIGVNEPFSQFNLDSLSTVTIAFDLEGQLGFDVDPTIFYEFDTINKLVNKILP